MNRIAPLLIILATTVTLAQNATTPGPIDTPYPTITCLAVDWLIEGDENLNCTVAVKYRESGTTGWHEAMPLRRVPAGNNLGFSWHNKCSGSLFDLKPATAYEISLTLSDPDGGSAQETVTATTRPVPRVTENAVITDIPADTYGTLDPENGTEAAPRIYRSVDGSAKYDFVDLQNKKWVILWGLTIKSSGETSARAIKANGAQNCAIRYCTIEGLYGITAYGDGLTDCYIADNIITGTTGWSNATMGADGENEGEGIQFTGPGNVICHNRIIGFRDCISTMEDDEAENQYGIDMYNNDIFTGADDGIEADFCSGNCRVLRNRITNSYVGVSSQPGLGGPTYFIRNVMYNVVHAAFKFKRDSRGDVALHNTVVKVGAGLAGNDAMDFAFFRNNLAIGGPTGGVDWGGYGAGNPYAADIRDPGDHSSFDYDAVGVSGVQYIAKIGGEPFDEVEPHGIADITLTEVFPGVDFPNPPVPERDTVDLRPAAGSVVIDRGVVLPNINDGYTGTAPDCGAYEAGAPLPIYGPRPEGIDEESAIFNRFVYHGKQPRTGNSMLQITTARERLNVSGILHPTGRTVISLHSLSGRNICEIDLPYRRTEHLHVSFPVKSLTPGCYLVQVRTGATCISAPTIIR
ncbi:MAG: right-handed parallel beta-helix repeat-containing protein [Chitinispirillaceae bacterium]|nr:right-handed parallel beta-helix repeat-containing protein [Chitinispirillaceae bacterium]